MQERYKTLLEESNSANEERERTKEAFRNFVDRDHAYGPTTMHLYESTRARLYDEREAAEAKASVAYKRLRQEGNRIQEISNTT